MQDSILLKGVRPLSIPLEVDRSTETRNTLARRFYRQGGLAVRYGATREAYKVFPFRVLIVLPNEERRNSGAKEIEIA